MKNYFKWKSTRLIIILFIGGLMFLSSKLIPYEIEAKTAEAKTTETKKTTEQIIKKNKPDLDKVIVNKSEITKAEDIYSLIHQMANTLIVAEDNLIYGKIPINNESISQAMVILKDTNLISTEKKEVFMNTLQEWKDKDFSKCVQAHNYVWKLLNGNIGKATAIKTEYQK